MNTSLASRLMVVLGFVAFVLVADLVGALAVAYLVATGAAGIAVATRALPSAPAIVRVPGGLLVALVFTSWTTYLVADALAAQTVESLRIGIVVSTLLGGGIFALVGRSLRPRDLRVPRLDAGVAAIAIALSAWLMHARLKVVDGELQAAAFTWGDMGLHSALSRSFGSGANFPTEYPYFALEPIRYHFGFDFFAGLLQRGGFSMLWSFNLPGILGFTAMMLFAFATARMLFSPEEPPRWWRDRGVWAGFIAAALVMTNQSLGWERYLQRDGGGNLLTALRPSTWWSHERYLSAGPYSDDRIAMYNTPNAYLTQTHLIVAMAVLLLLVYVVLWQLRDGDRLSKPLLVGVGLTFGAAFWLNGVAWLAAAFFFGMLLVFWGIAAVWRGVREAPAQERLLAARTQTLTWLGILACFCVPALALGVPQALMLNGGSTEGGLTFHLGYLVCSSPHSSCYGREMDLLALGDWWEFVQYWWLNDGVFIPLLIVAFVIGSGRDRKILAAISCVFLWGSLFYVGGDIGGQNHKVFNLWENLGGPFVAFALVAIWSAGGRWLSAGAQRLRALGVATRAAAVALGVLLVVTGLIDFMTVKNDDYMSVYGEKTQREVAEWIAKETPPRARFITDYDQTVNAPTLAGRVIALGYLVWVNDAGYDTKAREDLIKAVYTAPDQATACATLKPSRFDYVVVGPQERTSIRFKLAEAPFATMQPALTHGEGDQQYRIFDIAKNC